MPKRGQHDDSPGDARKPFSDVGGPAGKHAQSHDVRAEALTNPEGIEHPEAEFAGDLAPETPTAAPRGHSHADESRFAIDDKALHERLPNLTDDELARLPVVRAGTALDQGGVYLDLNDPRRQPFKAIGGERAEKRNRCGLPPVEPTGRPGEHTGHRASRDAGADSGPGLRTCKPRDERNRLRLSCVALTRYSAPFPSPISNMWEWVQAGTMPAR